MTSETTSHLTGLNERYESLLSEHDKRDAQLTAAQQSHSQVQQDVVSTQSELESVCDNLVRKMRETEELMRSGTGDSQTMKLELDGMKNRVKDGEERLAKKARELNQKRGELDVCKMNLEKVHMELDDIESRLAPQQLQQKI